MNGSTLELGILLGELRTEGRRQTEILLSMLKEQRDLPSKLAEHLSDHHATHHQAQPAAAPSPPPSPEASHRVGQWADLIKALWPLALLLAVVAGKVSVPEALPLIRSFIGLAP